MSDQDSSGPGAESILDQILSGFLHEFFTSLAQTARIVPSNPANVTLLSPIYSAKVVIDLMQHQLRQQLSKVAKIMRDFAPGRAFTKKEAKPFARQPESDRLLLALDFGHRDASVDELESML